MAVERARSWGTRTVSLVVAYLAATALVGLFLWLRLELGQRIEGPALILFTVPIIVGAYLGGGGVGVWATFVAVMGASYYLLPPLREFRVASTSELWQQTILTVSGVTISAICGALRRARARAETSRLAAERRKEELKDSQERLQTVVTNLTEGLILANMEGQLIHWNRASLEMHGFADEAEGRRQLGEFSRIFELATLDGQVLTVEEWPLSRVLRGEPLRDFEVRIRRRDANWSRIFSYGGALVQEPSGRQAAFVTITDITDRHRAVEAIQWMNAELEQHVRDRTAELESANHGAPHHPSPWRQDMGGSRRRSWRHFLFHPAQRRIHP